MTEQKEHMDVYFAMFNCHVNNGLGKTIKKFIEIWGVEKYKKCIKPFIDNGIMSMFNQSPNRYTKFFAFYNMDIVNGVRS